MSHVDDVPKGRRLRFLVRVVRSPAELAELHDDQLFAYFSRHARYYAHAPRDDQYAIRLGSRTLFAGDTRDLFQVFRQAVRGG